LRWRIAGPGAPFNQRAVLLKTFTMNMHLSRRAGVAALLLLTVGTVPVFPALATPDSATLTAQVSDNATILYVNPALGTDTPEGGTSLNTALRTITYALRQAEPGTVIQLAAGSYTRDTGEVFPLTVPQGVSIRGDESNKGQTVLVIGGGNYNSPTFATQNVTIRALNDSEVRGVTVTNPNTRGTGVWIESTNPEIRNNTFANSLRDGVFITGTANPIVQGNLFTGNNANGLSAARAARGEIRGNVFQNTGFGIAIGDTATPRVEDNQVITNTDGIVISTSARPVLRDNVIENNTRDGVVVVGSALPDLGTIEDPGENIIRNNGRYDLSNATSSNRIVAIGNQIDPQRISGAVEFVASTSGSSQFSDVSGTWAAPYIEALAIRGIIGGFPDGTYRPNDPVTRAQFAAIIDKAFTPTPDRAGVNFVDVSSSFWGNQAIQSAYRGGFLSGYPGRIFQPNQQIPRVQILVSLASGLELSSSDRTVLNRYQDAAQIPGYAVDAITAATQRGIVVNYPTLTQLNPNRQATRAEVAAFVYQALVSAGQADPISSPYVVTP
jgi:parallel beta-helix repeat protein